MRSALSSFPTWARYLVRYRPSQSRGSRTLQWSRLTIHVHVECQAGFPFPIIDRRKAWRQSASAQVTQAILIQPLPTTKPPGYFRLGLIRSDATCDGLSFFGSAEYKSRQATRRVGLICYLINPGEHGDWGPLQPNLAGQWDPDSIFPWYLPPTFSSMSKLPRSLSRRSFHSRASASQQQVGASRWEIATRSRLPGRSILVLLLPTRTATGPRLASFLDLTRAPICSPSPGLSRLSAHFLLQTRRHLDRISTLLHELHPYTPYTTI